MCMLNYIMGGGGGGGGGGERGEPNYSYLHFLFLFPLIEL